jgi:Xaa-Pro aminopeptidase
VHCNSYAGGYWTDITRTYCLGQPNERQRSMYEAVLAAREAALGTIRAGARAADVDAAAREALAARGFGALFKHSTGHGVGFAAIDASAQPRLHPASPDVLLAGMVCNIEPAIYIDGFGGIRHCDVVAVTESGCEVLTPFHAEMTELVVR